MVFKGVRVGLRSDRHRTLSLKSLKSLNFYKCDSWGLFFGTLFWVDSWKVRSEIVPIFWEKLEIACFQINFRKDGGETFPFSFTEKSHPMKFHESGVQFGLVIF